MVASPTSSGKRKEIKPMRSRPRAMLCDALVRRELGSCCVDLGGRRIIKIKDDRPRGERGSVRALVARIWIRPCARCDHDGDQIRVPMGSMSHLNSSPLLAAPTLLPSRRFDG